MLRKFHIFLQGINTKEVDAWEHLYADYYSSLCSYALKILKNREQVTDVVQGVIVRLWETEVHFEDMQSFHGYLYRAVYNNCLKVLRDRNVEKHYVEQSQKADEPRWSEYFSTVVEEEVVRKLRQVIDQMPEKRKQVMLLCLEEKTVEEVSEILGISMNTVKKHKKEAYQFVREMIHPDILLLLLCFHKQVQTHRVSML